MKKIFLLITAILWVSLASAQTSITLTSEEYAKLGPEAKSQITALQVEKELSGKIEATGKWVGLGKEIGTAMNESLTAITTTASNFAETKLGKFTMIIVAYKVIGTDVLQLAFGLLWILLILFVSGWIYFTNRDKFVITSRKWNSEGKGWEVQRKELSGDEDFRITAVIILCIGLVAAIPIIFA